MRRIRWMIGLAVALSAPAQEMTDAEMERALRQAGPEPAPIARPVEEPGGGSSGLSVDFESRVADGLLEAPLSTGLSYRVGRVDFHLGCSVAVDPIRGGTFASGLRAMRFGGQEKGAEVLAGAGVTIRFR